MISKSKFIVGHQCNKYFWLDHQNIKPTNPPDESSNERLSAGKEVGDIAKELFPGGIDIPYIPGDEQEMFEFTKKQIEEGASTLYEATFIFHDLFIRVDIMNKTEKGWDIYEVKSSSGKPKDYHKYDASFQWHVLEKLNLVDLNEIFIVTLEKDYSKDNLIEPTKFFKITPVTEFAQAKNNEVEEKIDQLRKLLNDKEEPEVQIGAHCKKPHGCEYFNRCWPKNMNSVDSVFTLYRMKLEKKLNLYDQGIDTFAKIGNDVKLSSTQENQLKAYLTKTPVIDKEKIKNFINKIEYPISYIDFETFQDAVPIYDKQSPHMQMPFQYSLHIQNSPDEEILITENHHGFIADPDKDPRRFIAEDMINHIPQHGTIMAFNESFEKKCINNLADFCPDLSKSLRAMNERFIDLIEPFRGGGYYDSGFRGSFSIKKVLPSLCPDNEDLDYNNLHISNGGEASSSYNKMRSDPKDCNEEIRAELHKYCRLDTYAMYRIFKKINQI